MTGGTPDSPGTPALRWLRRVVATPGGYGVVVLCLGGLYFVLAKLGLRMALINPSATAIWAPTGLAFAAFLLLGPRVAPSVLLAAFAVNITTYGSVLTSLVIAVGNAAEGWIGARLVRRFAGGEQAFRRPGPAFRFVLLAAVLATAVSATLGVGILAVNGLADWKDVGSIWLTWWLGDAVGAIIVAPVIVLCLTGVSFRWSPARVIEALVLAAGLSATAWIIFRGSAAAAASTLEFFCVPFLLWAALRFSRREAALSALLLALVVVSATVAHLQSVAGTAARQENQVVLVLQAFVGVAGLVTLVVSTVAAEQRETAQQLRRAKEELEGEVNVAGEALADAAAEARLTSQLLSRAEQLARTGSFRWDAAADRLTCSSELVRISGRAREELSGSFIRLLAFLHPDDAHRVRAMVAAAVRRRLGFRVVARLVRPDGEVRHLDSIGEVTSTHDGRVAEIYGVCRDVTEEHTVEARFQALLESAPDAMVVVDQNGAIVMVNDQAQRLTGYSRTDMVGHFVELLVPERYRAAHPGHREGFFVHPATRPMGEGRELYVRRKDGTEIPADISLSPLQTTEGILVTAVIRDITNRRLAEESIRQLSHRLLQVQDEAQQRIAADLQSGVVRTLDALRAELQAVRNSGIVFDWKTADALRRGMDLARQAGSEVRTLSHMVYPRLLEESGLVEAIRYFQGGFQERSGIRVFLDLAPRFGRLAPEAERSLFRVVQESLANVQQHAAATTAWVNLRREASRVVLEVRDNGRGFHEGAEDRREAGFGIRMLSERMRQLSGWLDVQSSGTGTVVIASLPASADP